MKRLLAVAGLLCPLCVSGCTRGPDKGRASETSSGVIRSISTPGNRATTARLLHLSDEDIHDVQHLCDGPVLCADSYGKLEPHTALAWRRAVVNSRVDQPHTPVENQTVVIYLRGPDIGSPDRLEEVFEAEMLPRDGTSVRLICKARFYEGPTDEPVRIHRPLAVVNVGRLPPGQYEVVAEIEALAYAKAGSPGSAVGVDMPKRWPSRLEYSFRVLSVAEAVVSSVGFPDPDGKHRLRFTFHSPEDFKTCRGGRVAVAANKACLGTDQAGVDVALSILRQLRKIPASWVEDVVVIVGDPDGAHPELTRQISSEAKRLRLQLKSEAAR